VIREKVDEGFDAIGGWTKKSSGDVDWMKSRVADDITTRIGVEVRIAGRNAALAVDIIHLRRKIMDGALDAGIIVVPNETFGAFLAYKHPTIADAIRLKKEADFNDVPIMLMACLR
jgi:hypothetical protein